MGSDETDAPLPLSKYPKTLLVIATAAVSQHESTALAPDNILQVERALTLTVDGNYDFVVNKLVAKPDPNHSSKKATTGMFAFSETVWEPRVAFYLEKGISKLKEKDWGNIMKAADYSNGILLKGKQRAAVTQEELELLWDSESE